MAKLVEVYGRVGEVVQVWDVLDLGSRFWSSNLNVLRVVLGVF